MGIFEEGIAVTEASLSSRLGAYGEIGELYIETTPAYTKSLPVTEWTVIDSSGATTGEILKGSELGGVTADVNAGTLTFTKAGTYKGSFNVSFSLSGGATISGAVYMNGVLSTKSEFERTIANANDVGNAGISSLVVIAEEDLPAVIDFRMFSTSARVLSIRNMNINAHGVS